jgi:hypothetical protein
MAINPDDEIVGYETAIVDGVDGGMRDVPVRRGDWRRRALIDLEAAVVRCLNTGYTVHEITGIVDRVVAAVRPASAAPPSSGS